MYMICMTIVIVSVLVASPDGGVDIEEVAEKTPDRIKKIPVDIRTGVTDEIANEIAKFLGFEGALGKQCAEQASVLFIWKVFQFLKPYSPCGLFGTSQILQTINFSY